jgi:DNA-binding response OmpR family regulator
MGADDYLTKPFSMRELLAHVKAKLRRVRIDRNENQHLSKSRTEENILRSDDLSLDLERRQAFLGSQSIELKPMEFELLHFLMKHKGKLLSRPLILQQVWGWEWQGESRTVDVHIRWLREKIEKDAANPQRIVTVRGAGYRFEG